MRSKIDRNCLSKLEMTDTVPVISKRLARSRAWNNAHKERVKETTMMWQQENKQRVAAVKRKRYAENPEYYRQKQREYRARRKEGVENK